MFLNGEAIPAPNERGERVVDDSFLLCFNAHSQAVDFVSPGNGLRRSNGRPCSIRPTRPAPVDLVVKAGEKFSLQGRSLLVLRKTA